MVKKRIAVIALGGNALIKKGENPTIAHQTKNTSSAMENLLPVLKNYSTVITHGNGPQVGNILIRVEEALEKAYRLPLEVCVAESQGEMGYLIEQSLQNILVRHHIKKPVITLLTQIIVDRNDPAFNNPTKPIGPFYTKKQAEILQKKGLHMVYQVKGGYRRVVPSPKPKKIDDVKIIKKLVKDAIIIAAGGGGIPVIKEKNKLRGIPAVIDKDYASAVLARDINADLLLILTGVKCVYLDYGKKSQRPIKKLNIKQAEIYLKQGHFPSGSMGPKIEAAVSFLKKGGRKVIITNPSSVQKALKGKEGTVITKR